MQVSKSAANAGFSANPELFIAETGDWIAENWLRIAIALGIAATRFGSKFFENGGVPPFAVTGNV